MTRKKQEVKLPRKDSDQLNQLERTLPNLWHCQQLCRELQVPCLCELSLRLQWALVTQLSLSHFCSPSPIFMEVIAPPTHRFPKLDSADVLPAFVISSLSGVIDICSFPFRNSATSHRVSKEMRKGKDTERKVGRNTERTPQNSAPSAPSELHRVGLTQKTTHTPCCRLQCIGYQGHCIQPGGS